MNVLRRLTKAQRAVALGAVVLVVGAVTVAAVALIRPAGHPSAPTISVRATASPAPPSPGTPTASNPASPSGTTPSPQRAGAPTPAPSSPTTAPTCPRNAMCIPERCPDTCTPPCPPNAMCVAPNGSGVLTFDDSANGTTITISPGERFQVTLGSTYWAFDPPSSATVLVPQGGQRTSPGPSQSCPPYPGSGCGTATQVYTAEARGAAVVSAHRTSCGEALRCTGSQGSFTLTVVVRTS